MSDRARAVGYSEVLVRDDLTGRPACSWRARGSFDAMAADDQLDIDGMLERFRERAAAVQQRGRCRRSPVPSANSSSNSAQLDFQDFAMIGDAQWTFVDGVLTLTIDLRPA